MDDFGTAVILAGGKSSRMGFDKQLLTGQKKRLTELVCDTLRREFDDILIITNRRELYRAADIRIHSDEFSDMGPLAGIHAALKHTRSRYAYVLACDMPIICLDYIRHMKERLVETNAQVCVTRKNDRLEPFNAFYRVDLLREAEARLKEGRSSMYYFISDAQACVIPEREAACFNPRLDMFTNINTKSEYLAYLDGCAGCE